MTDAEQFLTGTRWGYQANPLRKWWQFWKPREIVVPGELERLRELAKVSKPLQINRLPQFRHLTNQG